MLSKWDVKNSPPQQATARATNATVHVSFAPSRLELRLWPTVVAMNPDDAMALSIELQKAAIDARLCGYHRTNLALKKVVPPPSPSTG
jgi:hypothetical protein